MGRLPHFSLLLREYLYIYGLLAFISATDLVGYELTLVQGLEALLDDTGVVYKNLFAILGNNKSVTLLWVEPFNFSVHILVLGYRFCVVQI